MSTRTSSSATSASTSRSSARRRDGVSTTCGSDSISSSQTEPEEILDREPGAVDVGGAVGQRREQDVGLADSGATVQVHVGGRSPDGGDLLLAADPVGERRGRRRPRVRPWTDPHRARIEQSLEDRVVPEAHLQHVVVAEHQDRVADVASYGDAALGPG